MSSRGKFLRPRKRRHLLFHGSDHDSQIFVYNNVIEQVLSFSEERKVVFSVLEPVANVLLTLAPARAKTVEKLAQPSTLRAAWREQAEGGEGAATVMMSQAVKEMYFSDDDRHLALVPDRFDVRSSISILTIFVRGGDLCRRNNGSRSFHALKFLLCCVDIFSVVARFRIAGREDGHVRGVVGACLREHLADR